MTVKAVAVVIPAHNEERLLPRALDAVRRAAAHPGLAGVRIATVVVTDSCVDRTAEIAARAQAVVVSTDCQNPGTARSSVSRTPWTSWAPTVRGSRPRTPTALSRRTGSASSTQRHTRDGPRSSEPYACRPPSSPSGTPSATTPTARPRRRLGSPSCPRRESRRQRQRLP